MFVKQNMTQQLHAVVTCRFTSRTSCADVTQQKLQLAQSLSRQRSNQQNIFCGLFTLPSCLRGSFCLWVPELYTVYDKMLSNKLNQLIFKWRPNDIRLFFVWIDMLLTIFNACPIQSRCNPNSDWNQLKGRTCATACSACCRAWCTTQPKHVDPLASPQITIADGKENAQTSSRCRKRFNIIITLSKEEKVLENRKVRIERF